jgi:hypothetical protein
MMKTLSFLWQRSTVLQLFSVRDQQFKYRGPARLDLVRR